MTTDLVEKCAIAASLADNSHNGEPFAQNYRNIVLAVIDALADGVSDEMVAAGDERIIEALNDHSFALRPKTPARLCFEAMIAAIRAAKSREG